jgi:hypothetical protein
MLKCSLNKCGKKFPPAPAGFEKQDQRRSGGFEFFD